VAVNAIGLSGVESATVFLGAAAAGQHR
jgi:hypothetical protein